MTKNSANNMICEHKEKIIALLKKLVKDNPYFRSIVGHNDISKTKTCLLFNVRDIYMKIFLVSLRKNMKLNHHIYEIL